MSKDDLMKKYIAMDDCMDKLVDTWQQVKSEGLAVTQPNLFDLKIWSYKLLKARNQCITDA